ncbi:MAG: HAD-IA family hydrolase [Thermoleophilia bacterium]|nr:HAD-IA family hydrolase [Thermoleophilia bacterium]
MARPVRCVLFDFGGTLFGHDSLATAVMTCARALGRGLDDAESRAIASDIDTAAHEPDEVARGRDLDAAVWWERWGALYGRADRRVPGLGGALRDHMHDPLAWRPYRGALATMRALRDAGTRVGVVSNTGWDIREALRAHGALREADAVVLSCEVGVAKPDPRIFAAALTALDADPRETLMVGDDAHADGGAAAAGMRVLLLPATTAGGDNGIGSVRALVERGPAVPPWRVGGAVGVA